MRNITTIQKLKVAKVINYCFENFLTILFIRVTWLNEVTYLEITLEVMSHSINLSSS